MNTRKILISKDSLSEYSDKELLRLLTAINVELAERDKDYQGYLDGFEDTND